MSKRFYVFVSIFVILLVPNIVFGNPEISLMTKTGLILLFLGGIVLLFTLLGKADQWLRVAKLFKLSFFSAGALIIIDSLYHSFLVNRVINWFDILITILIILVLVLTLIDYLAKLERKRKNHK